MPQTYIAFLFSIGIGEGRRLVMADWRSMMEDIGLQNPQTVIATGNAIFQCRRATIRELELELENAYKRRFGRHVDTIVRSATSFRHLTHDNPFPKESEVDGSRVMVRVMRKPLKKETSGALEPYLTQGERLKIVHGDLWVHFKHAPNRSRLLSVLGTKRLGTGTVRNWNTVCRLSAILENRMA